MVQSATAMLACDRCETALRTLVHFRVCTQHPDGSFAQNFFLDGTPYWTGIQLDEVAFPIMLAWRLWKRNSLQKFDVFPFVEKAAGFSAVCAHHLCSRTVGRKPPATRLSTLATVIAGLVCAADLARAQEAPEMAEFLEDYADWIEAHLDEWTTTDDGYLLPGVPRHYMRIRPPCAGEPFYNPGLPPGFMLITNREPDEQRVFDAREIVDAGFLEPGAVPRRQPD